MGGHGTWQVGVTVPDRWAAIAPSAGWRSFSTYGGGPAYKDPTPVEKMLVRANDPGETPELARNFLHYGIYILHGDQDDNVPVGAGALHARTAGEVPRRISRTTSGRAPATGGATSAWTGRRCSISCAQHTRPADADVARVEFVTANPGISATSHWVTMLAQQHPLEYSQRDDRSRPEDRRVQGHDRERPTALAGVTPRCLRRSPESVSNLDGSKLRRRSRQTTAGCYCERRRRPAGRPRGRQTRARRGRCAHGGFKDAFRHHVVLVYGTLGTAEDRARAYNKARFDAESFWYRGNGSVDVVPDKAFDPAKERDRNVVLYGNADTNAAWATLLGSGPIEIRNGRAAHR